MAPASTHHFTASTGATSVRVKQIYTLVSILVAGKVCIHKFCVELLGIPERDIRIRYDALSSPGAPLLFNWGVHEMLKRYDSSFRKGQVHD